MHTGKSTKRQKQVKEVAGTSSKKWTMHKRQHRLQHKKNEDLKGKEGGRLKHYNVDGAVPLCLRKIDEESKDGCSSFKKNSKEKNDSGSSTSNSMKDGSKSKMISGSKDLCGDTIEKKSNKNGKTKSKTPRLSCDRRT